MTERSPVSEGPVNSLHPKTNAKRVGAAALAVILAVTMGYGLHAERGKVSPAQFSASGDLSSKPAARATAPDFVELVQTVKPAVVSVRVRSETPVDMTIGGNPFEGTPFEPFFGGPQGEGGKQGRILREGQGSAFFISPDGYAVTNNHVVADAVKVELVTDIGDLVEARVVGTDPKTDVALLKVDQASEVPYVKFAESYPKIGEWVVAMGNPFGLGGTVTAGIVSGLGRDIGAGPYDDFLQIDAAVNRGNSGGPTFNFEGQVVGVNTAIFSPSGGSVGIAFAIPSATVQKVVADLKERGFVERGWLGVQVQPVTQDLAEAVGLKQGRGALVTEPQAGSPAAKAGLHPGDVITHVGGTEIKDARALAQHIAGLKPGSDVKLTVIRDGKSVEVTVRLGKLEERREARRTTPGPSPAADDVGKLGLTVAPASITGAAQGLAVIDVERDGLAAELGIQPGDIILRAAGREVRSGEDLRQALAEDRSAGKDKSLLLIKRNDDQRFIAVPTKTG